MIWSPLVGGITLGAQLPPLPIRVSGDLQAVGFKKSDVITSSIPSTPPWLLTRPAVNFTLHCSDKSNTIAYLPMALKKVRELLLLWSIETTLSVFNYLIQQASSELNYNALLLAIDVVRRSKENDFLIFSDSMSSLQSINGFNLDSDLVQKFLKDYTILAKKWQKHYSLLDPKSCGNPR